MRLTSKLTKLLPIQTGTGNNGIWDKQDVIFALDGQYPKKVCISIWGDKINDSQLQIENILTIDFDLERREYNERWYTELKAWKISTQDNLSQECINSPSPKNPSLDNTFSIDEDDFLPF